MNPIKKIWNSFPPSLQKTLPIILFLITVMFTAAVWYFSRNQGVKIQMKGAIIRAEVAITPEAKVKGLLGRSNLPEGHGLLFLFDSKGKYQFHMNGMQFPIDIIWIDDTKIVDVTKNAVPSTGYPYELYNPSKPVNRVLEVPAGTADKYGIVPGDGVTFLKK